MHPNGLGDFRDIFRRHLGVFAGGLFRRAMDGAAAPAGGGGVLVHAADAWRGAAIILGFWQENMPPPANRR